MLRAWRWFTALRRTRPFWGCLWMILGGWTILKYAVAPLQIVISHGMSGVGGYLTGGGLVLSGVIPLIRPSQRYTFGILGLVLAVVSLIVSNLGGFLVGMLLGVVGGAMTVGWGPKPARRPSRRAARRAGASSEPSALAEAVEGA